MVTAPSVIAEESFTIRKKGSVGHRQILTGTADIEITGDPQIIQALHSNARLPLSSDPIRISSVRLGLGSGKKQLRFSSGSTTVGFSASLDGGSGLGIYVHPNDMLRDIAGLSGDGNQRIPLDEIPFPKVDAARYSALFWRYDLQAAAKGEVALGAGAAVKFGAEGRRRPAFAVIWAHKVNPRGMEAVRGIIEAWCLPRQIESIDDLAPGTWIVSEVNGSFGANVGVNVGLDYSWIRSITLDGGIEGLEGDIGLKIQAGASAALGFKTSGRYIVLVGRDSLDENQKTVRVRLHRIRDRNWSFAFNTALDLTPSTEGLLPAQLDDFISAVLGVHGLQILEEVRRWTDPSRRLSDLAAGFLVDYARHQLDQDFDEKLEDIRRYLTDLFQKWDTLGSRATSALWDAIRLDQEEFENFVGAARRFADPNTVDEELQAAVADVGFFSTPTGKWFLSVVEDRVLSAVTNRPEAERVRTAAEETLDILDGQLLEELKDFVAEKVGLEPVRSAIEGRGLSDLENLGLLKERMQRFLGKKTALDGEDFEKIRKTIRALDARGQDLYQAAIKALNQTYRFSFDHCYQRCTTKTALLDVCFDFGANPELGTSLQRAIQGDFTEVLPAPGQAPPKGVTFGEAALSHHIQRQARVKLTLPFYAAERTNITTSLATYRLLAEEGNIFLYSLDATDEVRSKGKWRSSLSLGLSVGAGNGNEIRKYDREDSAATIDYRFVQAVAGLRTAQLELMMKSLAPTYFPSHFGGTSGLDVPSVREWAIALDKVMDGEQPAEDGLIGNCLITLDVSLPGGVLASWLHSPSDRKDRLYMLLALRFQRLLRRFIRQLYFQNVERYETTALAYPLLVYAALPPSTSIRQSHGQLQRLNTHDDVYWDWLDEEGERHAVVFSSQTHERLIRILNEIVEVLSSTPGMRTTAPFYAPDEAIKVQASVLGGQEKERFESLLFTEATLIRSAVNAGTNMAAFRGAVSNPPEAVKMLADFGDSITRIFNRELKSVFKPKDRASRQLLRNLGTLMFAEVTEALDPGIEVKPTASLDLAVFNTDAGFPPRGFPEDVELRESSLSVHQRVLEIGTKV